MKYDAVFVHESGQSYIRDGFYHQNYARSLEKNKWVTTRDKPNFKVRYAFPLAGKWTVKFREWQKNELTREFPLLELFVQSSTHPGFVKVHPNRKNLMRGENLIYPVGANLFSPVVGNNLYYSGNPKEQLDVSCWKRYHNDVKEYQEQGGKYIRFIMEPTASEIEFEKVGNYSDRLNYAWEMDQLLEFAEEKDLLIQWNCMIQSPFKIFDKEFQSWDFSKNNNEGRPGYGYSSQFELSKPSEIFTNEEAYKYFKERYRYIIARWGYSPQIYFFELISEPFWLDIDDRVPGTPYDLDNETGNLRSILSGFHTSMAKYIKEELKHTSHLLAALNHVPSTDNIFYPHAKSPLQDESWASPNIDIISMNMYKGSPAHFHYAENNIMPYKLQKLQEHYQKPLFFSETQFAENLSVCAEHKMLPIDLMATGFIGAAGFNIWEVFYYNLQKESKELDDRKNWKNIIESQRFMESKTTEVLGQQNGNWSIYSCALNDKVRLFDYAPALLEGHWYISELKTAACGVLLNRTYNIYTNRVSDSSECASLKVPEGSRSAWQNNLRDLGKKKNKIVMESLKPKHVYAIVFYEFMSNNELSRMEVKSNRRGIVKFEHPILSVTNNQVLRPALWFTLQQKEQF